jgi:hypothetical protein
MRCSILAGIVGTVLMYFSILGWCAPSQNLDDKPVVLTIVRR